MKTEINLLDVFLKLVKHRWFIIKTVLIITIISLIISLLWPKTYRSTVRILTSSKSGGGFSNLFGNLLQPLVSPSEIRPDVILVVLRSRKIEEKIIRKFDLDKVYGIDIPEHLLKKLESNIEINEIREGGFGFNPLIAIEFSFMNEDPKLTQNVTEYYIEQLDSILNSLNRERAQNLFEILEKRYIKNLEELNSAEENMKIFQEKHGIFEIESQTKALIENLAEVKAKIVETEIKLAIFNKSASSDILQVQQLLNQKKALEDKYKELIYASESISKEEPFQPLQNMPNLMVKYANLFREVTVQNEVYKFIYPQYEQMKLQTQMQEKSFQILDPAKLPTYKYKPKRAYIVIAGFLFSLFLSIFLVGLKEMVNSDKEENGENYQKITYIINTLKQDLKFKRKN